MSGVTDERIVELYAEAELAVVPSLYEGFSLPAVEAMATGTCLVATDGGALPEVTGRRRRHRAVVPAPATSRRSPPRCAAASTTPALRARVGAAGRQRVVERWSWRHCAQLTVDQYREVLAMPENQAKLRPTRGRCTAPRPWTAGRPRPAGAPMLTVRYEPLGVQPGDLLLDLGCGFGRHAFEAARRGARVVACDYAETELKEVRNTFGGHGRGRRGRPRRRWPARSRATPPGCRSPTAPSTGSSPRRSSSTSPTTPPPFGELARVLRPGGTMAVTVPSWLPEKVCWVLSDEYHAPFVPGRPRAHLPRAGAARQAARRRRGARLRPPRPRPALAVLVAALRGRTDQRRPTRWCRATGKVLEWDIVEGARRHPRRRPAAEPVLGKSLVVYATQARRRPA